MSDTWGLEVAETVPVNTLGELSTQLACVLKPHLTESCPVVRMTAELIGTSELTLKRQLAKSGLTFRELLQKVRFEKACRLLKNTDMPIIDITSELSYESSSNFTRAFHWWAGLSPSGFRKQTRRS